MNLAQTIIHQQQPNEKSCVSACIGMLLGLSATRVQDDFHQDYLAGKTIEKYLSEQGIQAEPMLSVDSRAPEPGSLYLIGVPSLNMEGHLHQVIFDYRNPEKFKVFDPNMGRLGKKYYVWKDDADLQNLEVNINSYNYDYRIKWELS